MNVCVQCVLPFTSSWISIKAEGRHSNVCNDVLVTCGDDRAVHLGTILSIQCAGAKYSHPTHNGETEARAGDVILLQLLFNIFTSSVQNFMKGRGTKEVCFR